MFSELELEYKMAENLVDSHISVLSDLPAEIYQCRDLLKNPLIWANTELTDRITSRMTQAELLLCDLEQK